MRKIIVSDGLTLINPTENEIDKIKKGLTFNNPAYKNALRYSKYKRVSIPPFLMYYEQGWLDRQRCIKMPIGFDINSVLDDEAEIEDRRVYNKIKSAPFMLDLRPDQKIAAEEYFRKNKEILPLNGMIQMPTGKGKSILGLYVASQLSCKTLVVVHKDDLVSGWKKDIDLAFNKKVKAGIIKAQKKEIGDFITIATVQTLSRMSGEELEKLYKEFGLVIQDECLVGDTVVVKNDGGISFIKDIKNGDKVACVNSEGEVANAFSRKSPTVKINFSKGFLEGSPNHPTFCVKRKSGEYRGSDIEVKQLKDITTDYLIPVAVKIPHGQKNFIPPELSAFLALILCSGHLDKVGNRVKTSLTEDKEYYANIFKKGCEYYNAEYKDNVDIDGNYILWTNNKKLKDSLEIEFGIPKGKKSKIIEIPEQIFYAPPDSIKAFIETCFNCAKSFSRDKNGEYRINFNTSSKIFAIGLQLLLRKFGIVANFQELRYRNAYRINCGGKEYNKFIDTFEILNKPAGRNENTSDRYYVGDYYLSKVNSVKFFEEEKDVYDFEVKDTHTFIANGAFTHNCHHCPASSYKVVSRFMPRYRLGLSATPERTDGLDHIMNLYYGGLCYKYKNSGEEKDILPVKVKRVTVPIYFNPICEYVNGKYEIIDFHASREKGLRYNEVRISDIPYDRRPKISYLTIDDFVVRNEIYKEAVCSNILLEYYKGRNIVAFFTQKEHCRIYYDYLAKEVGEENIQIFYGDSRESNVEILDKAERGEVRITLATYAKSTEGTNVKAWEVAFLVSSINNEKNTEQVAGRIRRTKEGKINPAILYDFRLPYVYSFSSHGNTRDRRYSKMGFIEKTPFSRGY